MLRAVQLAIISAVAGFLFLCGIFAFFGIRTARKLDQDLDDSHRVLVEAGLTAKEARLASTDERTYFEHELPVTMDKINRTIDGATATLGALQKTADALSRTTNGIGENGAQITSQAVITLATANTTIQQFQPVLGQARASIAELDTTLTSANAQLQDSDIAKTEANIQTLTGNLAVISTDGKNLVEKYTHPSKKKLGFWGGVWAAIQVVHKLEPPIF